MANVLPAARRCHAAAPPPMLLHGRGAGAKDMLALGEEFGQDDIAYLAPEAPNRTWYPYSFLAPLAQNEPHLSNALDTVGAAFEQLAREGYRARARRADRLLARRLPRARIRRAQREALWRGRGPERRADRPAGHAARLSGLARRHAGVSRLQRRRRARPARAGA